MPLAQGFVLFPLNTVGKRDSEERRVIVDLSWPCGHSVNDGIPSDSYLGEPLVLRYPTIDDIVDGVVALGHGCHLYKCDLQKVHHQFPVDSKDYPFLRYTWDKHFLFRHHPHDGIALCSYGVPTLYFSRCLDPITTRPVWC